MTSCVPYVPDPENTTLLKTALEIFRKFDKYPQALRLALQLNDPKLILEIFQDCKEPIMQKQLAFMLGRHQHFLAVSSRLCIVQIPDFIASFWAQYYYNFTHSIVHIACGTCGFSNNNSVTRKIKRNSCQFSKNN